MSHFNCDIKTMSCIYVKRISIEDTTTTLYRYTNY